MPTVLYVDDDPAVRMVVRRQLEYHGLQVYTAEGVREAKERIVLEGLQKVREGAEVNAMTAQQMTKGTQTTGAQPNKE
jgi:CheY-like chemotaxis protein